MANGEKSGTWGSITNSNLGTLIEDAITGLITVPIISTAQALTAFDGVTDESRNAAVRVTSALSSALSLYVPPVPKLYVFINATNVGGPGTTVTVFAYVNSTPPNNTTAAGTGIAVPAGASVLLRCDGVNVVEQLNTIVGDLTVKGALIASGSPTFDGNLVVQNSAFLGGAQTAAINVSTPSAAVVTVAASPVTGAAITFSSTIALPTGITSGTTYYVSKINATTFNFSTSPTLTPLVVTTAVGSGVHTVSTMSLAQTPPAASNNTQLATTEFVKTQVAIQPTSAASIASTNWTVSETFATQAVSALTIAAPGMITVPAAPANGTAVAFSVSGLGALPTGITANVAYYVFNRTATTYNLATTPAEIQTAIIPGGATFNGTIAGSVLTAATPSVGTLAIGQTIAGTGVTIGTTITSFSTGIGGAGTYGLSASSTVASSTPMTATVVPGVVTVNVAPTNGQTVVFSTTGTLPTGITAGTAYFVVNRTSTTFQISATLGGTGITFGGASTGTHTATWYTLVTTTGTATLPITETTSKIIFAYKALNKFSVDLGGNMVASGNVTAYGSV
jgi:hypothetical protein